VTLKTLSLSFASKYQPSLRKTTAAFYYITIALLIALAEPEILIGREPKL